VAAPARTACLSTDIRTALNWHTNPVVIRLRDLGRVLGVNKRVASYFGSDSYEAAFDAAFAGALREGDVVWDVGANVGHYTTRFAGLVGPAGTIIAFEPSRRNFAKLSEQCGALSNVRLHNYGLGQRAEKRFLAQGDDELGATSRIVAQGAASSEVELQSGSELITANAVPRPNAIKLDVEGFELEVIQGLRDILDWPGLRIIGVEVHFRILNERGLSRAPREIEALMQHAGFRVRWPDSSHLLAERPAQ
jgi:FkbM family methyltransferase